jgi:hypothetical protein
MLPSTQSSGKATNDCKHKAPVNRSSHLSNSNRPTGAGAKINAKRSAGDGRLCLCEEIGLGASWRILILVIAQTLFALVA